MATSLGIKVLKFLKAARSFIKNNKRIKKDDILRFAKQEFGEVSDLLKLQIEKLFKTTKGTPSKSKGEVVPIKKQEGRVRKPEEFATRKEYEKYLDETLGPADDVFGSPMKDDLLKEWDKVKAKKVTPDIKKVVDEKEGDDFIDFVRKSGDEEGANKIQKEVDRLNKAIEDANKRVEIAEGIKSTDEAKKLNLTELEAKLDKIGKEKKIRTKKQKEEVEKRTGKPFKEGPYLEETAEQTLKKRTDDIASGDPTGEITEGVESLGTNMKKLKELVEELKKTSQDTTPGGIMKEILKGQKIMAEGYKKGNIRTAVRFFMRQEADAGKLKLSEDDYDALQVYAQTSEGDPINIFRRYYGEDALDQIDEIGDVFRQGESFNHYVELLRESVHPTVLTPKTKGLGQYDPNVLTPKQEDELREQLLKDQEQKQLLEDFDPTDRTKNALGGEIKVEKSFVDLINKVRDKKLQDSQESDAHKQMRLRELINSKQFPELEEILTQKLTERVNLATGSNPFTQQEIDQRKAQSKADAIARNVTAPLSLYPTSSSQLASGNAPQAASGSTGTYPSVKFDFSAPSVAPTINTVTPKSATADPTVTFDNNNNNNNTPLSSTPKKLDLAIDFLSTGDASAAEAAKDLNIVETKDRMAGVTTGDAGEAEKIAKLNQLVSKSNLPTDYSNPSFWESIKETVSKGQDVVAKHGEKIGNIVENIARQGVDIKNLAISGLMNLALPGLGVVKSIADSVADSKPSDKEISGDVDRRDELLERGPIDIPSSDGPAGGASIAAAKAKAQQEADAREQAAAAQAAAEAKARREREAYEAQQRMYARNEGGNNQSSSPSSSGGGSITGGGWCFDPNTLVQMADGSEKKIKEIQLGDQTKGGEVTGVFQFKAADEIHDYKGVTVAGSHYVKEDGKFIMVQDSPISVKINKIPVVYSLDTTGRRIFIKGIEFADYNGDGIAKGFLHNAGLELNGFNKEVLRQVENRLI